MFNIQEYEKAYISTAATTQVYTGRCILDAIVVNSTAAGTISIIDATSGSTVNVGILASGVAAGVYEYHCVMNAGIRIITGAASDITVLYHTA